MKIFSKLAVAAAASLVVGAAQAAVIIDLFAGNQGPISQTNHLDPLVWAAQYGPDNTVAGLYRDIAVKKTSTAGSPNNGRVEASVFNNGTTGSYNFSVGSQTRGLGVVRWDGGLQGSGSVNASGATGGTAGGAAFGAGTSGHFTSSSLAVNGISPVIALQMGDSFQFDVLQSDLNFTFWFELYDTAGNFSKYKLASQAHLAAVSTPIPVAAFASQCVGGPFEFGDSADVDGDDVLAGICSSSAFDITKIGAIQFIIESKAGAIGSVDLSISALRVVPEPGSLALVGLGLLGAAGAGMRRRRA